MAGMSRGSASNGPKSAKTATKVVKTQRKKKSTPSSRRHHFERFAQRISKMKIDPLRRTRRGVGAEGSHELEGESSYFRTALDEWKDLNLSENFSAFAKQIYNISDTLAMVIFHEEAIMDNLITYITKGDVMSLEPLLALLSHFAHDLDVRFEKHFQRAVATVAHVAASNAEPEVVEWSFTCLAFLFKYLSRLLVPDLRPLYDLMSPYLGKQKQKPYVVRFASEAMSFLVRKAGTTYHKSKEPLDTIVDHMLNDFASNETASDDLYSQGLMALFTESIKGVQGTLHSGGNTVLQCLTRFCFNANHSEFLKSRSLQILRGSLISVIHHTTPETFESVQEAIFEFTDPKYEDAVENLDAANTLLFTAASVRKGSRISDWPTYVKRVTSMIKNADKASKQVDSDTLTALLNTLAVVLNYGPFDAVLQELAILDTISRGKWIGHFLPFCNIFAELNQERFQSFVLPIFQKFIVNHWKENETALCAMLPSMSRKNTFAKTPLQCPLEWQKVMLQRLKKAQGKTIPDDKETLHMSNGHLAVLRISQGDQETRKSIAASILSLLKSAAKSSSSEIGGWDLFALGQGFQYISDEFSEILQDKRLAEALCSASTRCKKLVPYWTALNSVLQKADIAFTGEQMDSLVVNLIECLKTPSHDLRLSGLRILHTIYEKRQQDVPELLTHALSIEDTPPSVQTARFISSQIRRLALGYPDVLSDPVLSKAIPTYCFGLLHIHLAQAWEDSIAALKEMTAHGEAEELITGTITQWLQGHADAEGGAVQAEAAPDRSIEHVSSDFECSNMNQIEKDIEISEALFADLHQGIENQFKRDHIQTAVASLSERSQALRALNSMPQLAEKRSRLLVPVLLEWAGDESEAQEEEETGNTRHWGRKDQKAMLGVFAQFQNPRVLFKATEVYQALLNLLTNGDNEIQKSTLKAILAWKTPSIIKYQEHLLNFLDDARFREEVSVFLRLEEEGDAIRSADCPELMPVLLRILYGKAVTRAGSASGKRGQQTRRKAVFVALARFPAEIVGQFLSIALGSLANVEPIKDGALDQSAVDRFSVAPRKQVGLLNMLDDMVHTLGNRLDRYATKIADAVLLCLLKATKSHTALADVEEEITAEDESLTSLDRAIRQAGFHCLIQVFSTCTEVSWYSYAKIVMSELVGPRLEKLPIETAQSVSAFLRLFSTWASSLSTCNFLTDFYPETLNAVADCLVVPSAKNEVKAFIIEHIIGRLLDTIQPRRFKDAEMSIDASEEQDKARASILGPRASLFVVRLGTVLRQAPPKDILDSSVLCVSRLAPLVTGVENIRDVVDVSIFLLSQPSKTVHFTTKRDLLQTLFHLIPGAELNKDEERFSKVYSTLCPLFGYFKDRESRELLAAVVKQLADERKELSYVASLCEDLNSFSTSRLDEPDFERRAIAFSTINEEKYSTFTAMQWQPLIYSMMYFIRDNDELAIRTNASTTLRRFIEVASVDGDFRDEEFKTLTVSGLHGGLQGGMRDPSELVRSEYLQVLAHMIKNFSAWDAVNDMACLLVEGDEEASFFNNILHIQQHRRLRALRRLSEEAHAGAISSNNVSLFFIPLLEHFIFDPATDDGAHNLSAETINTVGALSGCLDWNLYRSTLRRFVSYIQSKQDLQKIVLRIVSRVIDALDRASESIRKKDTVMEVDGEAESVTDGAPALSPLAATLPTEEKLSNEINKQLLPPLTSFLHLKDESTVSLRVPVGVAVVKLIRVLPVAEHALRLPTVLMDLCHVLRSKAAEARDMTRKTLSEITGILGPSYFQFVIKELRSALQRGYQLHVMSFTMHSILVDNIASLEAGDLDHCINDIIAVVMDDIFGVAGQEKDAEEYISKMKEVKSSKSYDSAELIAKITTTSHLGDLIRPIQSLLLEKLDLKTVKKIDELLRRIGLGTSQNMSVKDRDILIFGYEIIQKVYVATAEAKVRPVMEDYKIRKYLIQMQSANKSGKKGATSSYIFKLTRFALDLVRAVLAKHDEMKTPANLAGFLPILGDALIGGQEEVQMASVRLLTSIIRVPSSQIVSNGPVYAAEAVKILRGAPSMITELAQSSLKLISAILRDRPDIKIKENDMAFVLKRIKPDLEEPDRQGVIFNFLKAVVARKIIITEVYEVMDSVAAIMVTNQTRSARDLSRGVYFAFMMEYPQAGSRLNKQIAFLVRNLEYKYVEGRQSVLELLHLLLAKTQGDLVQELSSMLFVPLVMMMVNDDSPECREMAGALISKILQRADEERTNNFVAMLRTWLEQDEQVLLRRIALQCWTIYIGHGKASAKETSFLFKQVSKLLNPDVVETEDWELLYYALQAFAKMAEMAPSTSLAPAAKASWTNIFKCLVFPHAWVKLSAARLLGLLFADMGNSASKTDEGLAALPLYTNSKMDITAKELHELCAAGLRTLRFSNVSEQLVGQTVRNLIFLGRCYSANDVDWVHPTPFTRNGVTARNNTEEENDEEEEEDEAAGAEDEEEDTDKATPTSALHHLLSRLAALIRRDDGAPTASVLSAKTGALQALASLCNILPSTAITPSLSSILTPLYLLTDPTIAAPRLATEPLQKAYQDLKALATEVSSLLQKKLGSTEYVVAMRGVQERVRGKREERRRKRRIEAVSQPVKYAADKRRKHDVTKARRKEKSAEERGKRRGW
ncbi:putative HEAT repeat protein [Aureobasidium subglaciale]|nr:putative HEAT repeat protein [Aureobasidium subglaciale]KAI5225147.1 putative HEAT repeat protein [Aureobasidium subglaciale]KAI5228694.1 putative HEAT repeat protein [Aureobasidium subglaciale]KAI5263699.1 putative HEAT repeat protein [Aureobasidium subglaciale]